jgi:hypothetical protein
MKFITMFSPARAICLAGLLVLSHAPLAFAKPTEFRTEDELKGNCGYNGGTFFPSNGPNTPYACIDKGGGVTVCGGKGIDAGTCDYQPRKVSFERMLRLRGGNVPSLSIGN